MIDPRTPIFELLNSSRLVLASYLADMTFEELCQSPGDGANPVIWQIGHLISEEMLVMQALGYTSDSLLPPDFIKLHRRRAREDAPPGESELRTIRTVYTKDDYLAWMEVVRSLTLSKLSETSIELLSSPGPTSMRSYAPTVSSVFITVGAHEFLHAGQLAVLRRKLQKPVII